MEDYIFLILAVVISIFAAIKKKKKKTFDETIIVDQAERPRNFFMDQLLGEDFLEENEEEEFLPAPREKPLLKKEPLIPMPQFRAADSFTTSFKSTLPERLKKNPYSMDRKTANYGSEIGNEEEEDSPGYLDDFSLRKAIIYSEIMNRKYEINN